ncbi:hypothetical protein OG548_23290 [Streptomyces sp. NBC_01356]|uniref:hypothetical protein n=1 Tax=Streptomyces sp. NBC_01356 TaxID=2903836 RepID=UPI002E2FB179|nr:hypothetical protein [Streptomyces sp. NBC_01356]
MLLVAVVAALACFVGVGASMASAAPAETGSVRQSVTAGSTKTVAVNGLRLRAKPGYNGYVKGLLYRGDRVFVRETFASSYNPNWVGVVLKQRSKGGLPRLTFGYVYKSYLR